MIVTLYSHTADRTEVVGEVDRISRDGLDLVLETGDGERRYDSNHWMIRVVA